MYVYVYVLICVDICMYTFQTQFRTSSSLLLRNIGKISSMCVKSATYVVNFQILSKDPPALFKSGSARVFMCARVWLCYDIMWS